MPDTIVPETPADAGETQACSWTATEALQLVRQAGRLGLSADIVAELRERGVSPAAAKDALIDAKAAADERIVTRTQITGGVDHRDPEQIRTRMADALLHRIAPGAYDLPDASREFRGTSLAEMKRTLLEARGIKTRLWTADEVLTRSDIGGLHTTSDFPGLLSAVVGKELDRQIAAGASPLKTLSRPRTASDFKTMYINRVGSASGLEKINEHGEFTRGTWREEHEAFSLGTFGRIWGITRQALINDDLSAFGDVAEEAALAAIELEASQFISLLVGAAGLGAVVSDGKTAFHADHDNVGTDAYPSVASLSEARQLMRAQKTAGGQHLVAAAPRALVVPGNLETAAEQLVAGITATSVDAVNPFSGKLDVAVEPRLVDDDRWYVMANGFFCHAYLAGNPGPSIATREGWNIDGVEIKVRLDFGCCVRDYRLGVTNAGGEPDAG